MLAAQHARVCLSCRQRNPSPAVRCTSPSCYSKAVCKLLQSRSAYSVNTRGRTLQVFALDAAQPFDFEHKMQNKRSKEKQLTIGIVGFGTFGQFLAHRFVKAGHRVLATSRTPYFEQAAALGAEFFEDADDFCEEHPDVVILATSILSTEPVLRNLPLTRLKRSTLFVDVLSVKVFPKQLLLALLPPEVDILCTHPMFGPDSGKGSWQGLNFMYEAVRVGTDAKRQQRLENFLQFFKNEGCRMVEMTCEEHDRQAASTQFVTHTVGRMLGAMQLASTDINTKGYEALLRLVDNTAHDSFDLYYGLFLYNTNATDELERLEKAFDTVKKQLLGRLHDIARKQLFPAAAPEPAAAPSVSMAAAVSSSDKRSSSTTSRSNSSVSLNSSANGIGGSGSSSSSTLINISLDSTDSASGHPSVASGPKLAGANGVKVAPADTDNPQNPA